MLSTLANLNVQSMKLKFWRIPFGDLEDLRKLDPRPTQSPVESYILPAVYLHQEPLVCVSTRPHLQEL